MHLFLSAAAHCVTDAGSTLWSGEDACFVDACAVVASRARLQRDRSGRPSPRLPVTLDHLSFDTQDISATHSFLFDDPVNGLLLGFTIRLRDPSPAGHQWLALRRPRSHHIRGDPPTAAPGHGALVPQLFRCKSKYEEFLSRRALRRRYERDGGCHGQQPGRPGGAGTEHLHGPAF